MTEPGRIHDDGLLTLAFYLAVDVSASMEHSGALRAAEALLPQIVDGIVVNPMLADVVRIGVVDFADEATIVLPLSDIRDIASLPSFTARGGTSYAALFRLLRICIEADASALKADGYKVYRPVVFFITDGAPTDSSSELDSAFAALTDPSFRYRPNIIPFGIGGAVRSTLDPWVYPPMGASRPMRSYVAADADPSVALRQLADGLLASVVASASSVADAGVGGGFILPDSDDLGSEWN